MTLKERGAALILVVVVIAALLAIAAPFVISMRLHERSARGFAADVQARHQAEAARNLAINTLLETHPDEERRAREARSDLSSDLEGHDDFDEIKIAEELEPLSGIGALELSDERGRMAAVQVVDTRGRIDINGSTAEPIASLLGVTVTTAPLSYNATTRIEVEDTSAFYTDYNPDTIDGFIRVGSEFIAYRDTTPTTFEGLTRGAWFSYSPEPEDRDTQKEWIPAGSLVHDGRGYKIAADALWRYLGTFREGELGRFSNVGAVRQIADWDYGALRGAMFLARNGITMSSLKSWGVREDDIFDAGLDPFDFDRDEELEDASVAERKAVADATRKLKQWGIPEIYVRRFGGDRAVLRFVQRIDALPRDVKQKRLANYKKRVEGMRQQLAKLESWLKAEVKRQLNDLSEMRNDVPKLEVLTNIDLEEKIRPFVTTDAPPEGAEWGPATVINHDVFLRFDDWAARFTIPDARRFQRGMIVRVQPRDGRNPEYRLCVGVQGRGSGRDRVSVFPQLDFDYEAREIQISAMQPRPLNVNTATRQVLRAALIGLSSRVGQRRSATGRRGVTAVSPSQAEAIAEKIVEDPPGNHLELLDLLRQLVQGGAIDGHAFDAVFRNAVDPGDPLLLRSTMPFCYTSGDVYELTASGFVNDPAGNEIARHRFREVVRLAPQRDLTWHLDSQSDFTDRVYVPGPLAAKEFSLSKLHQMFLPGRWANHTVTRPAHLGPFAAPPLPTTGSRSHAGGDGDLRPLYSREPEGLAQGSIGSASNQPQVQAGVLRRDDNLSELDGVDLGGTIAANQLGHRYEPRQDGSFVGQLGPTGIRGWFRLDGLPAAGSRAYIFDGGEARDLNRVSLYLEGGALVLETRGEALDVQETGGNPRSTRLIYTPTTPFQSQQWYHVAAFVKGSDRGDLGLAVDGRFGGQQMLGSRLSAAIDPYATSIPLEDASGFPDTGLVRVGANRVADTRRAGERGIGGRGVDSGPACEVLEYRKAGNSLVITRTVDLTQQLPGGAQITGIQDRTLRQPGTQSNLSSSARQPLRGSGHVYRVTYQTNANPPQSGRFDVAAGYAHDAGTYAVPFGYQAWVAAPPAVPNTAPPPSVIPEGGITLRDPIPPNLPSTLIYDPVPNYDPRVDPTPQIIDDVVTEIPVVWLGAYPDAPTGRAPAGVVNLNGGFPPRGILRVGSELVYYAAIDPVARRFTGCVRGFLGSTAAAHTLFEPVALVSLGVNYPQGYAAAPEDYAPQRPDLTQVGRVYLALPWAARTPAPAQEWISVQPALRGMDPRVDLIQQGLLYLPERLGNLNGDLLPFLFREMIRLNGNLGNAPGTLPFNDPGDRNHVETGVLVKEMLKRQSLSRARNRKGTARPTAPAEHQPGTELLPTFYVRAQDRSEPGPLDVVTVISDEVGPDGLRHAEEATVAYVVGADPQDAYPGTGIVSFVQNVSRPYRQTANARLNRWPIGNVMTVPDLTLGAARPSAGGPDAPQGAPGTLRARVDDLVVTQLLERPAGFVPGQGVNAAATSIGPVPGNPNGFRNGVLFLNDQEVYAAVDASPAGRGSSTVTAVRGALGTQPQAHSWETSPLVLTWPAIAVAEGGLGGDRGQMIPIRGGGEFRRRSDGGGYAAIDRGNASPWAGVWPFVERHNNRLERPRDELNRGTFPGAFGSNESQPAGNDLLVDLPFRFHDRYADRVSSIEGVFFEATRELPGALITTVEWDETLVSPYADVKVAVRLDGAPSWSARPATAPGQKGQLYVFDEPRANRDPNARKNEIFVRAKRVEVRVYMTFKAGALYNDAWKRPAVVGALRVRYRQPIRSVRREELVR